MLGQGSKKIPLSKGFEKIFYSEKAKPLAGIPKRQ
jgi:hypothetical protein